MSYLPVKQAAPAKEAAGAMEVELGEGSETDMDSEEASVLNWKRQSRLLSLPGQSLFSKVLEARVPLIVSIHFLLFSLILSIALGALLFKTSALQPAASAVSPLLAFFPLGIPLVKLICGSVHSGWRGRDRASDRAGLRWTRLLRGLRRQCVPGLAQRRE